MPGQVNMWLALAGSAIGVYIASIFMYRKFSVFDLVFSAISGAIAYSSSSDNNFNPGAAMTIGSVTGFVCALGQNKIRRSLNRKGVIDSNSVIFSFLLPSLFAAIFAAILTGVNEHTLTATVAQNGSLSTSITYGPNQDPGRSAIQQGGFLMAGWGISAGLGAIAGLIIGILYRILDSREKSIDFFSDLVVYGPQDSKQIERS